MRYYYSLRSTPDTTIIQISTPLNVVDGKYRFRTQIHLHMILSLIQRVSPSALQIQLLFLARRIELNVRSRLQRSIPEVMRELQNQRDVAPQVRHLTPFDPH